VIDQRNPVTQQRRLLAELRQARNTAGLSQQQAADALDWSLSKLIRIELGSVKVGITDLRAMLTLYGILDAERVDELVGMARASREHRWWDNYRKLINPGFLQYVAFESTATLHRQFQSTVVPALLQTEAYARSLITTYDRDELPPVIEQYIDFRMKRQVALAAEGVEFFFILDEAVLRRQVGGPEVMREQLARIKEVGAMPHVSIQVLPFSAGTHRAMRASFYILEVPTGELDDVETMVMMQNTLDDILIKNDADKAAQFVELYISLEGVATPATALDEVIDGLMSSHT
jgi:transcriptional regulator with XRE-family HTH domain